MLPVLSRTAHRALDVLESRWGLAMLLAVMLPLLLWRGSLETLWIDEWYSVRIAAYPAWKIRDSMLLEVHPAGYYLFLRAWLQMWDKFGLDAGPMIGRLPCILMWTLGVSALWIGGRALAGHATGTLMTWAVACNGQWLFLARNMRGYAFVLPMVLLQFLVLMILFSRKKPGTGTRASDGALWLCYALLAGGSMHFHLLAALFNLVLGSAWLVMAWSAGVRTGFFRLGLLAHLLALALAIPLLPAVSSQHAFLMESSREWILPASASNFFWVFAYWLPAGEVGTPRDQPLIATLGVLGLTAVAVAWLAGARPFRGKVLPSAGMSELLSLGIPVSVTFVAILYCLQALGVARVFHPPRYPSPAAAVFTVGLVSAAVAGMRACAGGERGAWLLLSPWLLAGALSQGGKFASEIAAPPVAQWLREYRNIFPPDGGRLYLSEPLLHPWLRKSLSRFDVQPVSELTSHPASSNDVIVLVPSIWRELWSAEEHLSLWWMEHASRGQSFHRIRLPPQRFHECELLYAKECDSLSLGAVISHAIDAARRGGSPPSANAWIDFDEQRTGDGWGPVRVTSNGFLCRPAMGTSQTLRLNRAINQGTYKATLALAAERPEAWQPSVLADFGDGEPIGAKLSPGITWLEAEIEVEEDGSVPKFQLLAEPGGTASGGSRDTRRHPPGYILVGGWIESIKAHDDGQTEGAL